jgi:hypothetical protein
MFERNLLSTRGMAHNLLLIPLDGQRRHGLFDAPQARRATRRTLDDKLYAGLPGYLLKLGMEIYSYNDHCLAPFSGALVGWYHQVYPGAVADIVYGINYTQNPRREVNE